MAAHHQACTRMMRGDYCGNGKSFGYDDVAVNAYDNIGIQEDIPQFWPVEAEWTEDGARCVSQYRSVLFPADECTYELPKKGCGAPPHWDKTLIVSELPN